MPAPKTGYKELLEQLRKRKLMNDAIAMFHAAKDKSISSNFAELRNTMKDFDVDVDTLPALYEDNEQFEDMIEFKDMFHEEFMTAK